MNETFCKNIHEQQAMNNWSNTSLAIAEIVCSSLNIIVNCFVDKKLKVDRGIGMFSRERLFRDASLSTVK